MTDSPPNVAVRPGILAAALLLLELLAGMQAYVLSMVAPLVAGEFHAQQYYGVLAGVAQIAMFVTIPLGPALLQRFSVNTLLLWLTGLSVVGGVVSALAPSLVIFLAGRAVSGLASGALATVSLAAIVTVLPPTWRRAVLAGYNAMWVCTSLVGPLYAGWIAAVLSWRWSLVLYLPLLLVARAIIARQLSGTMRPGDRRERAPVGPAIVLAGGICVLSAVGLQDLPAVAAIGAGAIGTAVSLLAAARLLPPGTLRARRGRPAALASMGLLTGAYFGAWAIMSILVHDLLGGSATAVAVTLGAGGLGWAVAGLGTSRWPASTPAAYARRARVGCALLVLGLAGVGAVLVGGWWAGSGVVAAGWALAGVGMGLLYLDTLNHIVDVPVEVDGVSVPRAAASAILVESIASAVCSTAAAAVVGRGITEGNGSLSAVVVLAAAATLAIAILLTSRRIDPGMAVASTARRT